MSRNLALILAAIAFAAVAAGGGYWLAMHRMGAPKETQTGGAPGQKVDTGERKVLYWHDPMVPGQKFDKPGKSPFMDMQLVPVYAGEAGDEGKVTISPRVVQNLGIRTAEAKETRMDSGFSAVGTVNIDERGIVAVQSRVNGYIEKLYVRAQYDAIAKGQRLADIYAPEWLAAQEEFLTLKRSAQPGAASLADAARQRLLLLGVSEQQLRRIEENGEPQPRVTLYAPESGFVSELGAREGMAVNAGMTLYKLANLGTVWVHAEVPETAAAQIKPGTRVEARAAAMPEKTFKGTVAALLPDVSSNTRTIKARVVLANPGGQLKPGMFATLDFGAAARTALAVPGEAVIYTGKRNVVIVAEEGGKFRPVEVETGRDSGDMTEIRGGLKAGDKVVTSGQFLIDSEASLKSTLSRFEALQGSESKSEPGPAGEHTGRGKVLGVDPKAGKIELAHEPIPSMKWPAMTMAFKVEDKAALPTFKAGDEVEFAFSGTPAGADYVITRLAKKPKGGAQ